MSEENAVTENTVELPVQDVGAWKEAATKLLEHGTDDRPEYGSGLKGIEQATDERIRRRKETEGDAEAPVIRHVGKDSKSPWKMAADVSFSKQLATAEQVFNASPTMGPEELFAATDEALHPSPRELRLDEGSDLPKLGKRGIDPRDGLNLLDGAEALTNWRERTAQQQAQELAQLQNEEAEREAWQSREAQQAEQTAQEQAEQARVAQEQEAQNRHLIAERARQAGLQRLQTVEAQAKQAAAELFAYGQQNFSDIASAEDLEQLRRTDPGRHRALMLLNQKATQVMSTLQQVDGVKRQASDEAMAQQKAARAAQREAIIAQQDQAAADAIQREIPDTPYGEIQRAAKEVLLKTGVSEAAIAEHWNGAPVDLRNPNVQLILAKAGAYDRAQQRAAEIRKSIRQAPPPPVHTPW